MKMVHLATIAAAVTVAAPAAQARPAGQAGHAGLQNIEGVFDRAVTTGTAPTGAPAPDLYGIGWASPDPSHAAASASASASAHPGSGASAESELPEPATWGMMLIGVGAVGFAMRRLKRRSDERFDARIKRITAGLED